MGVTRLTVRRAILGVLGGREQYDKLIPPRKKKPAVTNSSAAASAKRSEQRPVPKPEADPRGQNLRSKFEDVRLVGAPIVAGKTVELKMGETRVLLLQRLDSTVRITSARRTSRTFTDSLVLGGTIIVPHDRVSDVCEALREAAD